MQLLFALLFLLLLQSCTDSPVELRPFPYPYRAGLAICSDIDDTDSPAEFLTIQEYLCTTQQTKWGKGLGLEIGNSFWFYDPVRHSTFTLFDTTGQVDSLAGPIITAFVRAGYIDCLHTYGDFNDSAHPFNGEMAQKAADYFVQKGLTVAAWINHGNQNNFQCLGLMDYERGDNPNTKEYHTPYLEKLGIRYVECWNVTHRVSLDRSGDFKDAIWQIYELLNSLKEWLRTGVRDLVTNNRLLNPLTLNDGRTFWRFRRFINDDGWIPATGIDNNYLVHQLKPQNLDRLVKAGGYQIIYAHLGANEYREDLLPDSVRQTISQLADRFNRGEILLTTTTRLLDYNLATRLLRWHTEKRGDEYVIQIERLLDPLQPEIEISPTRLQGLTFYTPNPSKTRLLYHGQPLTDLQINPLDHTGRASVSIPWRWLEYPEGY